MRRERCSSQSLRQMFRHVVKRCTASRIVYLWIIHDNLVVPFRCSITIKQHFQYIWIRECKHVIDRKEGNGIVA